MRRSILIVLLAVLSVLLVPRTRPIRGQNNTVVGASSLNVR
jgi:hypothetical protein